MTSKQWGYNPKKRPVCICNDCGVDCAEIGEFYMAKPEIWDTLGLGWGDNLCIGCLEQRIGRRISLRDLSRLPNSPWECGIRMMARMFGPSITTRKPYRVRKGHGLHMSRAKCKEIAEFLKAEPPSSPAGR